MKRATGLFSRLIDPDFLEAAADLTVRGKRRRRDVAWFIFRREDELARLRRELIAEQWRPAPFELVTIRDPKRRLIARIPIADRILQTALVKCLEPGLTRSLVGGDFACRPGHGTHRAVLRLLELFRIHLYAMHLDVRAYFPSIDPEIVRTLLASRVRDRPFLGITDQILAAGAGLLDPAARRQEAGLPTDWPPPGRGLPIGSSLSQLIAAHLYLEELDHFIKETLRCRGYVRYVDDFFLFADRRADLRAWRREISGWLGAERGLRLKHPNARVLSSRGHLDALGYRLRREGLEPRQRGLTRLGRKARAHFEGRSSKTSFQRSVSSALGGLLF